MRIVGSVCQGKAGFGYIPSEPFPAKGTKDHRKLVSDTVFEEHDKRRLQEETEEKLKVLQFNWKSWNDYIRKDLSWKCIWATPPDLLRFIIGSTFNTLPSPNNRVRWRISDEDKCFLCGMGPCTVSHILSGCAFSLARASGRYSFRHDSVVKGLVEELIDQIRIKKKSFKKDPCLKVQFVKAGVSQERSPERNPTLACLIWPMIGYFIATLVGIDRLSQHSLLSLLRDPI